MSKLNKTLIAAAISGLLAVPAAHAVDTTVYGKSASGSVKITGNNCKNLSENKLDSTLYVSGDIGGFGFEGGFEGGSNTGFYEFSMFLFGDSIDGVGPLIASNKGRTLNQDTTQDGYDDLEDALYDYIFGNLGNDGCKDPYEWNYGSTMINKYETKLSNNGSKAKLQMDAEGTYEDNDGKDRKVKIKVNANMDNVD
jgi:hypothetical protein